jgi:hypothetical protein
MRLRDQSTLGWMLLPMLATTVLGHNVKQNPELLRGRRFGMSESLNLHPKQRALIDGPDIRNFKAGDMRYWSTETGEELTKEQADALPDNGSRGHVVDVRKDTGTIKVSA